MFISSCSALMRETYIVILDVVNVTQVYNRKPADKGSFLRGSNKLIDIFQISIPKFGQ